MHRANPASTTTSHSVQADDNDRQPGTATSTDFSSKTLVEELRGGFVEEPFRKSGRAFLPLSKIHALLQHHTILEYLLSADHPLHIFPDRCRSIANYVCGENSARRLFAVLMCIGKTPAILEFMDNQIRDVHLPLLKTHQYGDNFKLAVNGRSDQAFLSSWSQNDFDLFESKQYSMLSPVFELGEANKFTQYELDPRVELPCIKMREIPNLTHSYVWKITLDPEHHKLDSVRVVPLSKVQRNMRNNC